VPNVPKKTFVFFRRNDKGEKKGRERGKKKERGGGRKRRVKNYGRKEQAVQPKPNHEGDQSASLPRNKEKGGNRVNGEIFFRKKRG